MLPLNPILKDAFEKFEQDFLASNLPEGKYIKPPASTAKHYKVGQPCFEDKLQELNTDFTKIFVYCVNTSYPMDNSLSGRRRPARQMSEKDVLCFH